MYGRFNIKRKKLASDHIDYINSYAHNTRVINNNVCAFEAKRARFIPGS